MTDKQRAAIEKHGQNLLAIFPGATEPDPVKLCKALRRTERQASALALAACNGDLEAGAFEGCEAAILANLDDRLGFRAANVPVFLNGDPRGYALKIADDWMRDTRATLHQDMGGHGIIAPEFDKDGR